MPVPPSLSSPPHPGAPAGRWLGAQQRFLASPWAGPLLAMTGAVAFSGKAIIVKLAYRHGVDAITLIMLRMAVALPFFLLMVWWTGRGRAPLPLRDKAVAAALVSRATTCRATWISWACNTSPPASSG